ncbi:MAG: hypothetical protein AAF458_13355 [Pseudomonadota bacterium]
MIFTFYSYKGGVGRSMAMANVAQSLYEHGLRVVCIDWDLEAPGLEAYFFQDADQIEDFRSQPGLINLLSSFQRALPRLGLDEQETAVSAEDDAPGETLNHTVAILEEKLPPLVHNLYYLHGEPDATGGGSLALLSAGMRSGDLFANYAQTVQSFDWAEFYTQHHGEAYFEWLRKQLLGDLADVVLVDSRTGVTEMGGVCTRHLSDAVIVFCAPNLQNLEGTARMTASFNRKELTDKRQRSIDVLMVPTRLEDSNTARKNQFEAEFRQRFDELMPTILQTLDADFWTLRIPYIADYAFNERLAIGDPAGDRDLQSAYRRLSAHLAMLAPPTNSLRLRLADEVEAVFGRALPSIVVLPGDRDSLHLEERLIGMLAEHRLATWPPPLTTADSDIWREQFVAQLKQSEHLVLVRSEFNLASANAQRLVRTARQLGRSVLWLFDPAADIAPPRPSDLIFDLDKDRESLVRRMEAPSDQPRVPMMAPPVTAQYVIPQDASGKLNDCFAALQDDTAHGGAICIEGISGSGRTALAAWLCNQCDELGLADGGVLWLKFGEDSDPIVEIAEAISALTGENRSPVSLRDGLETLGELLRGRHYILVLEDFSADELSLGFDDIFATGLIVVTTVDSSQLQSLSIRLTVRPDLSGDEGALLASQDWHDGVPEEHAATLAAVSEMVGGHAGVLKTLSRSVARLTSDRGNAEERPDALADLLSILSGDGAEPKSRLAVAFARTLETSFDAVTRPLSEDLARQLYALLVLTSEVDNGATASGRVDRQRITKADDGLAQSLYELARFGVIDVSPDAIRLHPLLERHMRVAHNRGQDDGKYLEAAFASAPEDFRSLTEDLVLATLLLSEAGTTTSTKLRIAVIPRHYDKVREFLLRQEILNLTQNAAHADCIRLNLSPAVAAWPWFKRVVEEHRTQLHHRTTLRAKAARWRDEERPTHLLLNSEQVVQATELFRTLPEFGTILEREFISAGSPDSTAHPAEGDTSPVSATGGIAANAPSPARQAWTPLKVVITAFAMIATLGATVGAGYTGYQWYLGRQAEREAAQQVLRDVGSIRGLLAGGGLVRKLEEEIRVTLHENNLADPVVAVPCPISLDARAALSKRDSQQRFRINVPATAGLDLEQRLTGAAAKLPPALGLDVAELTTYISFQLTEIVELNSAQDLGEQVSRVCGVITEVPNFLARADKVLERIRPLAE